MPRCGACCELSRCEPVEARVRSVGVVVVPPFFDDLTRFREVGEEVLVEALVAQAAVGTRVSAMEISMPDEERLTGSADQQRVPMDAVRCVMELVIASTVK